MSLPKRIGRYEIVGRLASGGMAEILLARLTGPMGFERAVVVKRILPHLATEATFRSMFMDEARTVARIRHTNVVQVQELGEDDNELFLVMEYLEGESASALVRRLLVKQHPISPVLAAWVVAEAAAGLHAAHELLDASGQPLNLVHRDVSPQNVFISYRGEVKMLDFGIAKAADSTARTETGTFKGKFEYASPEQCMGRPIDRRSDIFALGVVLYETSTGRRLFRRDSQLLTMQAICDGDIPRPSTVVEGYPRALEQVLLRALATDPDKRHSTAAELRSELLRVTQKLGLDAEPDAALGHLMSDLFQDRIDEKHDLLRRVRHGSEVGPLPANESDALVEVPIAEATIEGGKTLETNNPTTVMSQDRLRRVRRLAGGSVLAVVLLGGVLITRARTTPEPERVPAVQATAPSLSTLVTIAVASQPSGAELRVDGEMRGTTPATVTVARSNKAVSLELRLGDHERLVQEVVPDVDQKLFLTLHSDAPPLTSTSAATFDAKPEGAGSSKPAPPRIKVAPAPLVKPKPTTTTKPAAEDGFRRFD